MSIEKLIERCKASVHLTINDHRSVHESVETYMKNVHDRDPDSAPLVDADVLKTMIEKDTIIELQFYPDTPVGFYLIYHHSLDKALEAAFECIDSER